MKYETWNLPSSDPQAVRELAQAGISPLVAAVMAGRGYTKPQAAYDFLNSWKEPLPDPMLMPDMDRAVARIQRALVCGEQMAVYGDYDVDGITATCLLTQFLRNSGGSVTYYIPDRIEEGYGLNATAVRTLHSRGVRLIITVDCGITAISEAQLCKSLGMDLIITDHHACRDELPDAVAVVNPHRADSVYPFPQIAGVGVAFKLAAALADDRQAVFDEYCDLVCLGTIADVMPLLHENRTYVTCGIRALSHARRPGLKQLIGECGITAVSATSIGYALCPRINAAGRLGQVSLATELILTDDYLRAAELADSLCALNRRRQTIEQQIYVEARQMLADQPQPDVIVLAGRSWHQGVVGIVASRLAEEYGRPTFLICLDGQRGKASSRSYGGFNLFSALEQCADLLESFGGHELAAGFTILEDSIAPFAERMGALARAYYANAVGGSVLQADCCIADSSLLTLENTRALDVLEPCGAAFARPVFVLRGVTVEQLSEVGGGKHLRLRLRQADHSFFGIFFSVNELRSGISEGDTVELAFCPQVNEFRGVRSVQLNITDIRPEESERRAQQRQAGIYGRYRAGAITASEAEELLPVRSDFVAVWRYLSSRCREGTLQADTASLSRRIARCCGQPCSYMRTRICLDVFAECGLIAAEYHDRSIRITLCAGDKKVDLNRSTIITALQRLKAGE